MSRWRLLDRAATLVMAVIVGCGSEKTTTETTPDDGGTSSLRADPVRERVAVRTVPAGCGHELETVSARYLPIARALCTDVAGGVGGAVSVAEGGRITFAWEAGRLCANAPDRVSRESMFRLGSVTKVITAAIVLELVDQGRLRLDASILDAVEPDLARPWMRPITIRTVLQHTSGLPERLPTPQTKTLAAFLETLVPEHPPQARWLYSNAGFSLLGAVLERAGASEYPDLVDRLVAKPEGLTRLAVVVDGGKPPPGTACEHLAQGSEPIPLRPDVAFLKLAHGARHTAPAGAVMASATDLVRFVVANRHASGLAGSRLASDAVAPIGLAGDRQGLAVRVRELSDATTLLHHSGNTGTSAAELWWIPERGFAVAVLSNTRAPPRATLQAALSLVEARIEPRADLATAGGEASGHPE